MESIEIIGSGIYLPSVAVENKELEKKFNVPEGYIYQRTGIKKRYYIKNEDICDMAYIAAKESLIDSKLKESDIDLIIVATTSTNTLMPGISYKVQEKLNIEKCICLDILAGCAGYVNAFDIAKMYINTGKIKNAMVIGVDALSSYLDDKDINTKIILSDGAGSTILRATSHKKIYFSNIQSDGKNGDILTCKTNEKIKMNGKAIYKYAVTETIKNIEELLEEARINMDDIKYIIPHQSNIKIMNSMASKLHIENEKMFSNIEKVGNTFCASIPIALDYMRKNKEIEQNDKIILIGYGGGLNTASILIEI